MWDRYMSKAVHNYFFGPMRNYVVDPISNAVSTLVERVDNFIGDRFQSHDDDVYAHSSYAK